MEMVFSILKCVRNTGTCLYFLYSKNTGCECKSRNGDVSDCGCYTVPGLPQGSCQTEINFPCSGSGSGSGGQIGGVISGVGEAPASVILPSVRPQKPRPLNDRKKVSIPRQ